MSRPCNYDRGIFPPDLAHHSREVQQPRYGTSYEKCLNCGGPIIPRGSGEVRMVAGWIAHFHKKGECEE